ncbi:MAG: DUF5615 family PIN-like protein [Betaproteobacteria bacterium]|nr:DUF5615 family PIN-like protein [Betaproteobacteria bacterium]
MKLVVDESVDAGIVRALRLEGHEVLFVDEIAPGSPDVRVLAMAADHAAPLVTADKDFGELVFRQGKAHFGVLLLRLYGLREAEKAELVVSAMRSHGAEFPGAFSVLTPETLRIRPITTA